MVRPRLRILAYKATLGLVLIGLLIERFGLMLTAFAIHDFSVRYGLLVTADGRIETVRSVSVANDIMRRVNFATNDMIVLGLVAHLAVTLGAHRAWRKYRNYKLIPPVDWRLLDYGVAIDYNQP